jgi:hypothetical protein
VQVQPEAQQPTIAVGARRRARSQRHTPCFRGDV